MLLAAGRNFSLTRSSQEQVRAAQSQLRCNRTTPSYQESCLVSIIVPGSCLWGNTRGRAKNNQVQYIHALLSTPLAVPRQE